MRIETTKDLTVTVQDDFIHITAGEIDLEFPIAVGRHLSLAIMRQTFRYHQAAVEQSWNDLTLYASTRTAPPPTQPSAAEADLNGILGTKP